MISREARDLVAATLEDPYLAYYAGMSEKDQFESLVWEDYDEGVLDLNASVKAVELEWGIDDQGSPDYYPETDA